MSGRVQILAFVSGAGLALAVYLSHEFSRYTSPSKSLLTNYAMGILLASLLFIAMGKKSRPPDKRADRRSGFLGAISGIPEAMAVLILFGSSGTQLGFASTVSLVILGQVITSIGFDVHGPFGFRKRSLNFYDFGQLCFTMLGIGILLFFSR